MNALMNILKTLARRLLADEVRTQEQEALEAQGILQESVRAMRAECEAHLLRLRASDRAVRTSSALLTEVRDALDEVGAPPSADLAQRVRLFAAAQQRAIAAQTEELALALAGEELALALAGAA